MSEDLSEVAAKLHEHAEAQGALVIDAIVVPARDRVPAAGLDVTAFTELIQAVKPRVVYLAVSTFDAEAALEEALTLDDEGSAASRLPTTPALKALAKRMQQRDGEIEGLVSSAFVDGVLHVVHLAAPWLDDFETEMEKLVADARESFADGRRALDAKARAVLHELAQTLAKHKAFAAGRSFEMRCYLAENLFPELDEQDIADVTSLADKLVWFAKHAAT